MSSPLVRGVSFSGGAKTGIQIRNDYEKFKRWVKEELSLLQHTIVSAQAEYEKLQQQAVKEVTDALEAHQALAITEAPEAAVVNISAELMQTMYGELREQHNRVVEEAKDYANAVRRLQLKRPTRACPEILAYIKTSNRNQSNRSVFAVESVEGDIEPRISSKSTYLPDPERLDYGLDSPFESWVIDMCGKLLFNAEALNPLVAYCILLLQARLNKPRKCDRIQFVRLRSIGMHLSPTIFWFWFVRRLEHVA